MKKPEQCLQEILNVIETVEARCMAADGPVTPTHQEITDGELRKIYKLAGGKVRRAGTANSVARIG